MAPETCPNCGADVPSQAKACPECGACDETGWSEEAAGSALGVPDDSFDYEDYLKREFETDKKIPRGISKFWWWVSVLLLGSFVFWILSAWF